MLEQFEALSEQVWARRRLLEEGTHALGGIGVGLLACSLFGRSTRRSLGYSLIALSAALHVYALVAAQQRPTKS